MRNHRVSLQDIATLSGVTKMTVSRYLRNPKQVSSETRGKIQEVMQAIEYNIDANESTLPQQKTRTIGLLIPTFKSAVFSDILKGLGHVMQHSCFKLTISEYHSSQDEEEKQIISMLSSDIEGIILSESSHSLKAMCYLQATRLPIVEMMDSTSPRMDCAIGFDNKRAAFEMVSAMIAAGKSNICYISTYCDYRDQLRFSGYQDAVIAHGLAIHRMTPDRMSSSLLGAELCQQALMVNPRTDGFFCINDDLAVGVLFECLKRGYRIPQDMAVAGFHGLDIGKAVTPLLASVITPRWEMGRLAGEMIINKIKNIETETCLDVGFNIFLGETV